MGNTKEAEVCWQSNCYVARNNEVTCNRRSLDARCSKDTCIPGNDLKIDCQKKAGKEICAPEYQVCMHH